MSELSLSTGDLTTGRFILWQRRAMRNDSTTKVRTHFELVAGVAVNFVILAFVKLVKSKRWKR